MNRVWRSEGSARVIYLQREIRPRIVLSICTIVGMNIDCFPPNVRDRVCRVIARKALSEDKELDGYVDPTGASRRLKIYSTALKIRLFSF